MKLHVTEIQRIAGARSYEEAATDRTALIRRGDLSSFSAYLKIVSDVASPPPESSVANLRPSSDGTVASLMA